jgi:hypothetical protein
MPKVFLVVVAVVILFVGFMIGYSIPPFIHAGVFSDRQEKGVKVEISDEQKQYYENLFKEEGGDE